jgi:hypothetical protein
LLLLLLAACAPDCEDFDPGYGVLDCDTVQLCTQGHDAWYETNDGVRYDCDDASTCSDMICDVCRMDAETRKLTCGG